MFFSIVIWLIWLCDSCMCVWGCFEQSLSSEVPTAEMNKRKQWLFQTFMSFLVSFPSLFRMSNEFLWRLPISRKKNKKQNSTLSLDILYYVMFSWIQLVALFIFQYWENINLPFFFFFCIHWYSHVCAYVILYLNIWSY